MKPPTPEFHPKLQLARTLARLMDSAVTIPGTNQKVGLDPLLGLFPVVGDIIGFAISLYIVVLASELGMTRVHLAMMVFNIVIDSTLGSVPLVGDIFDVFWRANVRNVAMMERFLARQAELSRRADASRRLDQPASQQIIDVVAESLPADRS